SVYLIRKGKSTRRLFWRKTNMLLFSDLAYRMKDNARMFFLVAIISTVAFSAIGSLVGFKTMLTGVMLKENPYAFEYTSHGSNDAETEQKHLALIEEALQEEGIRFRHLSAMMKTVALSDEQSAVVVKASEYNAMAEAAGEPVVHIAEGEAAM